PREKCQEPAVQEDGAQHWGQEESLHRLLRELAEVIAKPLSIIYQPYPSQPERSQATGDLLT
ncbi:hypothetical protein, partial [Klebsiella pneumoniae]|uniref:hypothetical protein n=1 Tax=Klebsiella pneumoniae TaxID=573 RepID=UPI003A80C048